MSGFSIEEPVEVPCRDRERAEFCLRYNGGRAWFPVDQRHLSEVVARAHRADDRPALCGVGLAATGSDGTPPLSDPLRGWSCRHGGRPPWRSRHPGERLVGHAPEQRHLLQRLDDFVRHRLPLRCLGRRAYRRRHAAASTAPATTAPMPAHPMGPGCSRARSTAITTETSRSVATPTHRREPEREQHEGVRTDAADRDRRARAERRTEARHIEPGRGRHQHALDPERAGEVSERCGPLADGAGVDDRVRGDRRADDEGEPRRGAACRCDANGTPAARDRSRRAKRPRSCAPWPAGPPRRRRPASPSTARSPDPRDRSPTGRPDGTRRRARVRTGPRRHR